MRDRLHGLSNKPEVVASVALGCVYLAVTGGHSYSIDGVLMYRQAVSIVHEHSLRFGVPIWWGDTYMTSRYGIGMSLLYLPGVSLLWWLGPAIPTPRAGVYDWDLFYRDPVYVLGAAPVQIVLTVATAYLVARFVRELGYGSTAALVGLVGYGIGSPAMVYARGDFAQPLLGFCLTAALLAAVRLRKSASRGALFAAAGFLCLGVLTRPVEGSFLLPAILALIVPNLSPARWQPGTYRALAVIVGSFMAAVVFTLLVDWGRFGSPLATGYPSTVGWGTPIWVGLPGVLISHARGILWQFPLAVLAPLGLSRLLQAEHRVLAGVVAVLLSALLLNTALWMPWWGAWSWGSRLFVPALPLVAVLAAIGTTSFQSRRRIWLPALLMLGGVVWAVPGTITNLLGGYAARYDGSAQSFALSGYPPIGAWRYVHHLLAPNLSDANSLDIIWLRLAHITHNLSIVVPVVLLLVACFLAFRVVRLEQASASARSVSSGSAQPARRSG
jgi:hypothetical protein